MKISTSHQRLSNHLNNPRVLDHPEEFLGPNWKAVLNFWIYLDTLTDEQMNVIYKRFWDISIDELIAAEFVAREVAKKITFYWYDVLWAASAENATLELITSHELLNQQKPFTFIPIYLNL